MTHMGALARVLSDARRSVTMKLHVFRAGRGLGKWGVNECQELIRND
jgi:hypothetical protein